MRARGPQVARPLLHERDLYLAWSCKRSRAVCGARAVVGVVGRSHLRGTAYHLLQARLRPCSQRFKGSNRAEGLCCSPFLHSHDTPPATGAAGCTHLAAQYCLPPAASAPAAA